MITFTTSPTITLARCLEITRGPDRALAEALHVKLAVRG
jgi:hypothetical protein